MGDEDLRVWRCCMDVDTYEAYWGFGAPYMSGKLKERREPGGPWEPPPMERPDDGLKRGDVISVCRAVGFAPSALEHLGDIIRACGELLPLDDPDRDYVVFNPLREVDAVVPWEDKRSAEVPESMRDPHQFRRDLVADEYLFYDVVSGPGSVYMTSNFLNRWNEAGLEGFNLFFEQVVVD